MFYKGLKGSIWLLPCFICFNQLSVADPFGLTRAVPGQPIPNLSPVGITRAPGQVPMQMYNKGTTAKNPAYTSVVTEETFESALTRIKALEARVGEVEAKLDNPSAGQALSTQGEGTSDGKLLR